jgi:Putative transposase
MANIFIRCLCLAQHSGVFCSKNLNYSSYKAINYRCISLCWMMSGKSNGWCIASLLLAMHSKLLSIWGSTPIGLLSVITVLKASPVQTSLSKDYKDESRVKPTTLSGVEFLRRFCMHILPRRFVKIRYYGVLSTKQKDRVKSLLVKKPETKVSETRQERIVRLTGFNYNLCPVCKTGFMHTIELLPKIRAPTSVLYQSKLLLC